MSQLTVIPKNVFLNCKIFGMYQNLQSLKHTPSFFSFNGQIFCMHFTSVSSLLTDGINTFLLKITFVNVETESNCVTMVWYMYLQWIGNNVETRDTFEIAFGTSKTVTTC